MIGRILFTKNGIIIIQIGAKCKRNVTEFYENILLIVGFNYELF